MSLGNYLPLSWLSIWKEGIVATLIGWVPFLPGIVIRRLIYRNLFAKIGTFAKIHSSVRFRRGNGIEIGNRTTIHSGVRLQNVAQNSKILIGNNVCINPGVDIKAHGSGKIEIGENTFIGSYVCFIGEFISLGKGCTIASHTKIYATNHNFADHTHNIESGVSYKGIVIEDDCWLGSGVRVVDGVTISQGSVIAAGAVVTQDIPPYSIAAGVPAQVIAHHGSNELVSIRNKEYICKDGSRLPIPLSAALADVEETAALLHAEVEETAVLLHQRFSFTDTVLAHLVLQNLLHQLLDYVRQVMAVDTVTVLLQTEDRQQLAVCATIGLEEEITKGIRIPFGRGFAGRIAASCKLTIVDNLSMVEVVSPILRNRGLQSMVGVPLLVKDQVLGVFHVGTVHPRQFTKDDTKLLQLVADHIGLAIEPLAILKPSITKDSELVREKSALTVPRQKVRQTIRIFPSYLHPTGYLKLA